MGKIVRDEQDEKDLLFLKEIQGRLDKAMVEGDIIQFDYIQQMIEDWIHELEDKNE